MILNLYSINIERDIKFLIFINYIFFICRVEWIKIVEEKGYIIFFKKCEMDID